MLQSEFFERTGVKLSAEEYAKTENVYNVIKMDKDHFCQEWKKLRTNMLFNEMVDAMMADNQNLIAAAQEQEKHRKELEQTKEYYVKEIQRLTKNRDAQIKDFARKIIENFGDDKAIYDVIEEEFTLDFIIKVKLENDFDLEKHEREHLLKKL